MLQRYQEHLEKIENLLQTIKSELVPLLVPLEEATGVKQVDIDSMVQKAMEGIRSNRKVKLGVIGQVKTGKSTLLNALIFEGEEILPTAATPNTARLSIIRGVMEGEDPGAEIFFYSQEDWNQIEEQAKREREKGYIEGETYSQVVQAAREKLGDKIRIYLGQSKTVGLAELQDYVSQDGKYSDIVKYTVIRIPEMPFSELEIVDTPGLNDPVRSREKQTIEFLKDADAAIFLPSPHRFLDKEDMTLVLRDMIRSGLSEVIIAVPQMDTLSTDQKEDFFKNCYLKMKERAERFAEEAGFGPKSREQAREVFSTESTVLVSAMAYIIGGKLLKNEHLSEDDKYLIEIMKRNGWSVEEPRKLQKESKIEELREKIENRIVQKKDTIILHGEFAKIEAFINEVVAQSERRIKETEKDIESLKTGLEERRKERKAELREFESFKYEVDIKLEEFERDLLKINLTAETVPEAQVETTPWFFKGDEEKMLAEEISSNTRAVFKRQVEELRKMYAEAFEKLEDSIKELVPNIKKKGELSREITSIIRSFEKMVKSQLQERSFNISVNFTYGFFDKLFGDAPLIAQRDVKRACKRATKCLNEALEEANKNLQIFALQNHAKLKELFDNIQSERQKKLQELETAITYGETEKLKLEKKLKEQMELFQKIRRVLEKIDQQISRVKVEMI